MDNRNNRPSNRNTNGRTPQNNRTSRNVPSGRTTPVRQRQTGTTSNATTIVAVLIVIAVFVNYNIFSKIITKNVPAVDYSKYEKVSSQDSKEDSEQQKLKERLADIETNYTDVNASVSDTKCGELLLVNKIHKYDFDARSSLVPYEAPESIYDSKSECYYVKNINLSLNKSAISALNSLLEGFAEATGHTDIIIVDAHRTYEMQQIVLDAKIDQYGEEQGRLIATEPGASEHHSGYAIDLSLFIDGRQEDYYGEGVYEWITKNCYKYGFIMRYPEDKTAITGIDYEPWHLRYVGIPHAYHMTRENLCLEEYIDRLAYYPIESDRLTIAAPDGTYEVYSAPVADGTGTIKVPKTLPYTLSGDNNGHVVVTVKINDTPNPDLVQQFYEAQAAQRDTVTE